MNLNAVHNLLDAAQAVYDGRIPALAERSDPEWKHSRISDSLTDKLGVAIKEADIPRPPLTHVAIRLDGVVWSLPAPYRHHHILNELIPKYSAVKYHDGDDRDQGFLDASGRYLNRRQAEPSAFLNNQVKGGKLIGSILTSEDLW